MTENDQKDQLGMAALRMVGSVAGYGMDKADHDSGVDFGVRKYVVRGTRHLDAGLVFDIQLKTSERPVVVDGLVVYDLEVKTYNDMVTRNCGGFKPLILVLMALKGKALASLDVRSDEIAVGNSLYWFRTDATEYTENEKTLRIKIPVSQKLDVTSFDQLARLLDV